MELQLIWTPPESAVMLTVLMSTAISVSAFSGQHDERRNILLSCHLSPAPALCFLASQSIS